MDEFMKRAALLLLFACVGARAQNLPDPTRPPAQLIAPVSGQAAPIHPLEAARLQSVLIGRAPGSRRVAVIDGQTVSLGATFKGAKLVRVAANEVELAGPGGARHILRLYPAARALPAARASTPSIQ
jgi:MSHA biogenesis protein MshK